MPNVKGLRTAQDLYSQLSDGETVPYGGYCEAQKVGSRVLLIDKDHARTVASVIFPSGGGKPSIKTLLDRIDARTATPVNVFLRDYGTTRINWRTNQREWKPLTGSGLAPAAIVQPRPSAPVAPVSAPVAAQPVVAAVAPSVHITVKPAGGIGVVIDTERRHLGAKPPKARTLTKTYSQVDDVLVPTVDLQTLERAWTRRQMDRDAHVLITGPAGTAKTRLGQAFAFSKGVPVLVVEGQGIQTAADWYGQFVPTTNGTAPFEWQWTDFGLALLRGEPMVIIIDEFNRAENERALNGLMSLLAWGKTVHFPGMPQPVRLAPGILVLGTLNEGIEYVGTVEVDAAVRDRFSSGIRMAYMPRTVEQRLLKQFVPGLPDETAKRLVLIAEQQRAKRDDDTVYPSHNTISPRVLIDIADTIVSTGCSPAEAIWASCKARFGVEDEPALSVLIESQFGAAPEPVDELPDDEDLSQMLAAVD